MRRQLVGDRTSLRYVGSALHTRMVTLYYPEYHSKHVNLRLPIVDEKLRHNRPRVVTVLISPDPNISCLARPAEAIVRDWVVAWYRTGRTNRDEQRFTHRGHGHDSMGFLSGAQNRGIASVRGYVCVAARGEITEPPDTCIGWLSKSRESHARKLWFLKVDMVDETV